VKLILSVVYQLHLTVAELRQSDLHQHAAYCAVTLRVVRSLARREYSQLVSQSRGRQIIAFLPGVDGPSSPINAPLITSL